MTEFGPPPANPERPRPDSQALAFQPMIDEVSTLETLTDTEVSTSGSLTDADSTLDTFNDTRVEFIDEEPQDFNQLAFEFPLYLDDQRLTSLSLFTSFSSRRDEVIAELGGLDNSHFLERIAAIVALSLCEGIPSFLKDWSESLEAEELISQLHAELHSDSSQVHAELEGEKTVNHTRNLLLLVAGYVIQSHFQPREHLVSKLELPSRLSSDGSTQYKIATLCYARHFHCMPALSVLAPSLSLESVSRRELQAFQDYALQHFPLKLSYDNPPAYESSTLPGLTPALTYGEETSEFEDNDSGTWLSSIMNPFMRCLPFRRQSSAA
ncbi:hypothetical protein PV08_09000 [Exophiala spinifera]|uniref:Uncharacterized protein n=1 Tax=Exophiala spinifera TaxID=91928 RepID=A0A0D2B4B9_9EURO|nr:uncharacterized protein PV08_09000 [Exophiala spinifera]KIW13808.1 hypothetical protein PV08_09000 [Exophiala spinifera]